jgi:hypothetical protein
MSNVRRRSPRRAASAPGFRHISPMRYTASSSLARDPFVIAADLFSAMAGAPMDALAAGVSLSRTVTAANTPGRLVSSSSGALFSGQTAGTLASRGKSLSAYPASSRTSVSAASRCAARHPSAQAARIQVKSCLTARGCHPPVPRRPRHASQAVRVGHKIIVVGSNLAGGTILYLAMPARRSQTPPRGREISSRNAVAAV